MGETIINKAILNEREKKELVDALPNWFGAFSFTEMHNYTFIVMVEPRLHKASLEKLIEVSHKQGFSFAVIISERILGADYEGKISIQIVK